MFLPGTREHHGFDFHRLPDVRVRCGLNPGTFVNRPAGFV